MRLTVFSDYSLRLLMFAAQRGERLSTIEEVASAYGISRFHLMKVAQTLGNAGFLQNLRGRSGGLRLARPAAEIRLGDVIRVTEEDMALVACFEGGAQDCPLMAACGLQGVLSEAMGAFMAVLDRTTLADVAGAALPLVRKADADRLAS